MNTPKWALDLICKAKLNNCERLSLIPHNPMERLVNFPTEILELKNLSFLDLSSNKIAVIPDSISELQNLSVLILRNNILSTIPESVANLCNLTEMDISINRFDEFPSVVLNLVGLKYLNISRNYLETIPNSIERLKNLEEFLAIGNQLSSIPSSISRLRNLRALVLTRNRLFTLPRSICSLTRLTDLGINDNPLVSPPIEIATSGIDEIRDYFRQLGEQGFDYIYEAKLLILGEGGAGKTTFANKIINSEYSLKEEDTTKGVDVLKWSFPIQGNKEFKVNIWDFGGQEIYHATHQFFLTKRSLYTLVADTRKDDTDFYYWLNIAELLSDGSPILIIKNEKQDRHREINERQLKGQFSSLQEIIPTNLATNRGLDEVKDEIKRYIQKLPHIGSRLPKTWVRVRESLEKDQRNHISLDEYLRICRINDFNEISDSLQLSGYLHDIGVFLHFQDEPLLKKTIILKPKWGTDAVYKVLDNKTVIQNLGRFNRKDLERIWNSSEYENMRDELLQLMMKFKLCYEIPNHKGSYIAPQLLTENQPNYDWNEKDNLLLRYSYEFMPKGILTQFIVLMHPYIWGHKIVWKSGVVIGKDQTFAEVIEFYGKREIQVRVVGPHSRELMNTIRDELSKIHALYKRLKYEELVRCNCQTCIKHKEPHFYTLSELMDFKANGQLKIQCRKKPYYMVDVMKLLGDTINPNSEQKFSTTIENYFVNGDFVKDKKMTTNNISLDHSTIGGSLVAAESIKNSMNALESSAINDEFKEQLLRLTYAVTKMINELPKEKAEEVADDMKRLSEEVVKEKPSARWYNVSIEGLLSAAKNLGKVGDEVISLLTKVRKILSMGVI